MRRRSDRLPNDGAKRHEEARPKARAALAVDFRTAVAVVRPAPVPESQNATLSPQLIGRERLHHLTGPVALKRLGGDEKTARSRAASADDRFATGAGGRHCGFVESPARAPPNQSAQPRLDINQSAWLSLEGT